MRRMAFVMLLVMIAAAPLRADTYHSKPDASQPGGVRGVVTPAKGLQEVIVVEPYELKCYQASVDASSGAFAVRGLPPGEYDLLIKTEGHVYEGLTLEHEPDQNPPFAALKKMLDEIATWYFDNEQYFDKKHIARATGEGDRARMFVMQTRTLHVVTPGGEKIEGHIRRFDFADLRKTGDAWQIVTNRHILRQEVPYDSNDIRVELHHAPDLGGLLVVTKVKDLGTIDLAKLSSSERRYPTAQWDREAQQKRR